MVIPQNFHTDVHLFCHQVGKKGGVLDPYGKVLIMQLYIQVQAIALETLFQSQGLILCCWSRCHNLPWSLNAWWLNLLVSTLKEMLLKMCLLCFVGIYMSHFLCLVEPALSSRITRGKMRHGCSK